MSDDRVRKRRRLSLPDSGPYVLKHVLDDIPLATEDAVDPVSITCVEFWNENLYIGTSAAEILHLVCLPSESPADPAQYILASRLQPSGHDVDLTLPRPGVQQILLLPGPLKACVLCNGTASFYTLPELSPAFPNREPTGVQWIGGYDENEGREHSEGTTIMIAMSRQLLQVRVGDKLRPIKPNIVFPNCLKASRRDTRACVADGNSYALLEIEHQQKIPLFEISTAPEPVPEPAHSSQLSPPSLHAAHSRSKSVGDFPPSPADHPITGALRPLTSGDRSPSPAQGESRPGTRPRSSTTDTSPAAAPRRLISSSQLKPHVLSPSANEFMLTTGTTLSEPGVGIFVNLDGDVSRGTIEFERYPDAVILCSFSDQFSPADDGDDGQLIIALLERASDSSTRTLQLQAISSEGLATPSKVRIKVPESDTSRTNGTAGLHQCISPQLHTFVEVADLLQAVRYSPNRNLLTRQDSDPRTKSTIERLEQENALFDSQSNGTNSPNPEYDAKRSAEELQFVQRLGHASTRALTWSSEKLWKILPNPLLLQLESQLLSTLSLQNAHQFDLSQVNVPQVLSFLGRVRDQEPQNETEFLSVRYVRQKASIILFLHLLTGLNENPNLKVACKIAESALLESELDPRLLLSLISPLSREVNYGSTGLWIQQGIVDCVSGFHSLVNRFADAPTEFWMMIRHFLSTWQEKRGASGSLTDEKAVFSSIDAALLHLLLHLDNTLSSSDAVQAPTRAKLNNIVDHWEGDFERAVTLLEHYRRLFLLSRLYASKKASRDVLRTFQRICEGDENADQGVTIDAIYERMRKYLMLLRDQALVQEYAIWLAQRAPDLAIQFLSDNNSRVKFAPAEVVPMLKAHAPGSVQLFLEHLVFVKNLDQYADDLVGYYLDSVLSVLETSDQARQSLADSYATYRALTTPKPTYLNFIRENAPNEVWWQSRLRLLQLLGSGGYATNSGNNKTLTYSIDKVLDRLKPFTSYLVSESIILDARQGRHDEALTLLVHGLGDYDTAIRYCYFGGPSPPSGTIDASMLPPRQQQENQFNFLFNEFLRIEDIEERLERTSHLLGTFAGWFDPLHILNTIPETWSITHVSEFLLRTFRAATTEKNQAIIIKALSAAQNLQKQATFIETCEKIGAKLQVDSTPTAMSIDSDIPIQ